MESKYQFWARVRADQAIENRRWGIDQLAGLSEWIDDFIWKHNDPEPTKRAPLTFGELRQLARDIDRAVGSIGEDA